MVKTQDSNPMVGEPAEPHSHLKIARERFGIILLLVLEIVIIYLILPKDLKLGKNGTPNYVVSFS